MPTIDLAKQADAVRADLARLESDLKALLSSVGGSIGHAISARVSEPLKAISGHIDPLLALLGAHVPAVAPEKRGPGRPKKEAAPAAEAPAPRKTRRGGRGRKANLTAEKIKEALDQTGGNRAAAGKLLKVSAPTFYKYLTAFGLGEVKKKGGAAAGKKRAAR